MGVKGCPGWPKGGRRQLLRQETSHRDLSEEEVIEEVLMNADLYFLMSDEEDVGLTETSQCNLDQFWFVVHYA